MAFEICLLFRVVFLFVCLILISGLPGYYHLRSWHWSQKANQLILVCQGPGSSCLCRALHSFPCYPTDPLPHTRKAFVFLFAVGSSCSLFWIRPGSSSILFFFLILSHSTQIFRMCWIWTQTREQRLRGKWENEAF